MVTNQGISLLLIDAKSPLEIGHEVVASVFDGGRFGAAAAGDAAAAVEQCRHGDGDAVQSLLKLMSMLLSIATHSPSLPKDDLSSLYPPLLTAERSHFEHLTNTL